MPVGVNELMWAAHECNWVRAALVLDDFILKGCNAKAIQNLLVRSPSKEVCDGLRSPESDGLRPLRECCFKCPHSTVLHLLANKRPGDQEAQLWNAYERCWHLAAAVLHNSPAIDARAGLPGSGGKTPLMVAAVQNNPAAMFALLGAGASGLRRVRD